MATVALPLLNISSHLRGLTVDLQPTQSRQSRKVLIESLLPSTVLSKQNQEYVVQPPWQQAS